MVCCPSVTSDGRLILVHPVFPGKAARILLNSHGTHGIHGPFTTLNVLGFPTPPGVIRPAVGFGCVKRVMGDSGKTRTRRGRAGSSVDSVGSVADLGWGGRATLSLQSLAPKFPEEPFFFRFLRLFFRLPVPFPFHGQ